MDQLNFFGEVPDFRLNRKKKHTLNDILFISVCAVISGADDYESIAEYGRQKIEFLSNFLELPNGIPSHDTFNRVFRYLDKEKFGACLYKWTREILDLTQGHQINIDGKVLRGTGKSGCPKSGLCIVSAWAAEQALTLGQVKVSEKSNEKTAIPELLGNLDLKGSTVTIDAVDCSETTALTITQAEGDYVLSIKKNRKILLEEVRDHLKKASTEVFVAQQTDISGGRIEIRKATVCHALTFVDEAQKFSQAKCIFMVESVRQAKNKEDIQKQTRYYISSRKLSPEEAIKLTRNHWSIENKLHWVLDVVFNEDQARVREGNGADNFATLRKIALQILYTAKDKDSVKARRLKAAWNNDFLLQLLQNTKF